MYGRILLPTDGSPDIERAAEHATGLAERYGAALDTLLVVDVSAVPLNVHAERVVLAMENEAMVSVDELVDEAERRGIEPTTGAVMRGTPHGTILDYVDANGCDLVVMRTHGRADVERFVLGSVTERVVRLSPVHVLSVPLPEEDSG